MVHCIVALAFCLKEQGKNYVNHIDRNPTNNKASNLEWCTQKKNMQHAVSYKLWNGYKRTVKQIFPDGSLPLVPLVENCPDELISIGGKMFYFTGKGLLLFPKVSPQQLHEIFVKKSASTDQYLE